MTKLYFDSSALFKRYIDEKGSDLVNDLFLEADAIAVNAISLTEIVSALTRLRREKRLNPHQYNKCKRAAIEDFVGFEVCPISPEVVRTSVHILERAELRASDALHVACAVEAKVSRFVSSDIRQIGAAKAFNLKVDSV